MVTGLNSESGSGLCDAGARGVYAGVRGVYGNVSEVDAGGSKGRGGEGKIGVVCEQDGGRGKV